jgi:hypothetical protein
MTDKKRTIALRGRSNIIPIGHGDLPFQGKQGVQGESRVRANCKEQKISGERRTFIEPFEVNLSQRKMTKPRKVERKSGFQSKPSGRRLRERKDERSSEALFVAFFQLFSHIFHTNFWLINYTLTKKQPLVNSCYLANL